MGAFIDIKGQRFGILTALEYVGGNGRRWKCKCDCGNIRLAGSYTLRDGRCKSCGCDNPKQFRDLTGKKYGKITVLSFDHKDQTKSRYSQYFWKCKCDCGNECVVRRGHLKSGKIQSCGCLLNRIGKNSPSFGGYEEIPLSYYNRARAGATRLPRNFEFSVSIEYLWDLFLKQNRKCALSGVDIDFNREKFKKIQQFSASLDRIDSSKGYIEGNVQWVHKDINIMKMDLQQNKFIEWCSKVAALDNHKSSDTIISYSE